MYISKKILSVLLLVLSFVFWVVYANSNISSLTQSVSQWDVITSEYYNNLNWVKNEWWYCKYSNWKLVCIDSELPSAEPATVELSCPCWTCFITKLEKVDYNNYNSDMKYYLCTPLGWQLTWRNNF